MFSRNMHRIDSLVRALTGVILIWIGFVDQSLIASDLVSWVVGAFGVLNLVSAVVGFCPVYHLAGFSTRSSSA